jgi:predicted DNA-binding protein
MLAIRLPAEVEHRLDALAKATGRSKTYYARQAILAHIDALERKFAAEQAAQPREDPFGAFTEWDSAADRSAYAGL